MAHIKSLQLTNFRSYEGAALDALPSGPIVLFGANGAGKTNVLEALSLLTPGKGLRGARSEEIQKHSKSENPGLLSGVLPWAVAAQVDTLYGPARIGTGLDTRTGKRIVRINGEFAKSQAALSEYLSCVWLTPQMDRLFLDPAGGRRRFLDRLVFSFDPGHAGRATRYENAMAQRSKLLKESPSPDPVWLEGLEAVMAETGVAIAAARQDFIRRLQGACESSGPEEGFLFPRARLRVTGTIEELLSRAPAVEVEEMFKYQLRETRAKDTVSGGAATGPHRSDLCVWYAAKNIQANQCSTGEQKALLIGIVLAHARLIAAERRSSPVLLLDEVAAHLDENRRAGLYNLLVGMKNQVWLTGTDSSLFAALESRAHMLEVAGGSIAPPRHEKAA